jgi:two-component system, cell cycle sensor histidine kinase and response regulator CckA
MANTNQATIDGGGRRSNIGEIARQISATVGAEFFESLVRSIGQRLDADCVLIGEFVGGQAERIRTLAVYGAGAGGLDNYPLAGSAVAQVAAGDAQWCTNLAQEQFPSDSLLLRVDAQAFVAVPLLDAKHRALGVMLTAFRHPISDTGTPKAALEVFAPRAAAELRRQQTEAAVRESEQRYRAFIAANTDAMWRIEFETPISISLPEDEQIDAIYRLGYLAECNDAMAHTLGRERSEQLIGMSFHELACSADPNLREDLRVAIRSGYRFDTVETQPVSPDGRIRHHLRSHWCIVENGQLQRIWGTTRDVTELKQAEEALENSERRLAELLENIHVLTIMLDGDGAISYCNNYLLQLTGWKASELAGKNWFDLMVPPEEREKLKAEFASARDNPAEHRHIEGTLVGKNGQRWQIAWESSSLRNPDGSIAGSAGVGHQIASRAAAELNRGPSSDNQNLRRSITRLVDDLGGLLTVITGYCAILSESLRGDELRAPVAEIEHTAEQGIALTKQLLAFSRERALHLELIALNPLLEEVGQAIAGFLPAGVEFEISLEPSAAAVLTDRDHFRQALLNLAANAVDAMPDGGSLALRSSHLVLNEEQATHMSGISAGNYSVVAIADTGAGMTEEVRDQMFEPFFTTKDGRTGIGLSAVYEIVKASQGHILVDSSPGQGTVFQIFLPRASSPK